MDKIKNTLILMKQYGIKVDRRGDQFIVDFPNAKQKSLKATRNELLLLIEEVIKKVA